MVFTYAVPSLVLPESTHCYSADADCFIDAASCAASCAATEACAGFSLTIDAAINTHCYLLRSVSNAAVSCDGQNLCLSYSRTTGSPTPAPTTRQPTGSPTCSEAAACDAAATRGCDSLHEGVRLQDMCPCSCPPTDAPSMSPTPEIVCTGSWDIEICSTMSTGGWLNCNQFANRELCPVHCGTYAQPPSLNPTTVAPAPSPSPTAAPSTSPTQGPTVTPTPRPTDALTTEPEPDGCPDHVGAYTDALVLQRAA